MTKLVLVFMVFCLQPALALANASFTAVAAGEKGASYVGVKDMKKSVELSSFLFRIDAKTLKASPIELPEELKDREIVAILPSQRQLYVVSQWTIEQGDNARLDAYDLDRKSWKKIGTADCAAFDAIAVKDKSLVFHCAKIEASDTEQWKDVSLPLGTTRITARPEIKLPQSSAGHDGISLTLAGVPNKPEELKIVRDKKESIRHARDLIKTSH